MKSKHEPVLRPILFALHPLLFELIDYAILDYLKYEPRFYFHPRATKSKSPVGSDP